MLGYDQPVILHLFHSATNVKDLEIALMDSVLPLLEGVVVTTNVEQACKGVGFAILIGEFSGKTKTFRLEAMANSFGIYKRQVDALEKHAAANCKVLVIANPADRLALVLKEFAPSIPLNNITCLTRPDHSWALSRISQRLNVPAYAVTNVIIWGNHSSTQYPNVNHAMVNTSSGEYLVVNSLTMMRGLPLDEFSRKKMDSTVKELMEQRILNVDSLLHCIWRRRSA
ncbi:hypothetical protein NL676_021310 [Syzygium grande]|nr:hypothetical protein NL676_021310 [Syzygium grande]